MKRRSRHATMDRREDRVRYFMAHPALLEGVPGDTDDVDDAGRARLNSLVGLFRDLDMLGEKTPEPMARDGVRKSITIAKRRIAAGVPASV